MKHIVKQVNQRITIKSKAPILMDDMLDLVQTLKKDRFEIDRKKLTFKFALIFFFVINQNSNMKQMNESPVGALVVHPELLS